MRFIADLHIHSHYSRATSKEMNIVSLTKWSQIKGTHLVGTGDFTHPKWFEELQEKLEPAEPGLFTLKKKYEQEIKALVPERCRTTMRFMLTVEVSNIYKKNDKVRKVHSLIYSPSFEFAAQFNKKLLDRNMNLASDGRPILGMHTKEVLQTMLDVSDEMLFVPAHIWTPHFAVFGSMSGYDSLEECFDELTPYIYAVETGLSADPPMLWRVGELDGRTIISNSDAHSPQKLGREANIFNCDLSYNAIAEVLKTNSDGLEATIEFYPEEGKYHLDGHRNCQVCLEPPETLKINCLCPKCGKPLTIGVMHQAEKLANHPVGRKPPTGVRPYHSIVPLPEIIAEVVQKGPNTKTVQTKYMDMLSKLGTEFTILLDTPLKDIETAAGTAMCEAIDKMRRGDISLDPGFDGEFGTVHIFTNAERKKLEEQTKSTQTSLF